MLLDTVFFQNCHQVRTRDGRLAPIRLDGGLVGAFNPGWAPIGVIDRFAPFHVLVLRNGSALAPWYLEHRDGAMHRLGGSVGELPPAQRAALSAALSALFAAILGAGAALGDAVLAEPLAELVLLDDATLADMSAAALSASPVAVVARGDEAPAALPHAAAAFDGSLKQATLELMRGEGLGCASPFDGERCEALIGLPMPWRLPLFLFADRSGRAFYVMPDGYGDNKAALFAPDARTCLAGPGARPIGELFAQLLVHLVRHHAVLARLLASPGPRPPITVVSDFPHLHIGHVMWNDVAALDELVRSLRPEQLPWVGVANIHQGSEVFGRVDALFPEFGPRVLRSELRWENFVALLYERGLFYCRYMTRHVGRGAGRRILDGLHRDAGLEPDRDLFRRLEAEGFALVCLGLRFGNRTIPDQLGFAVSVVEHLLRRLPRLALVVDGTSARIDADPSTLYGAFGPASTEENLVRELQLGFALRRRFAADDAVRIIGTAGRPIAASLFWIERCRFFVAPWGAALAKYRWVCNLPGFVMSARVLLARPGGDLPIYHDPAFNEAPSPMEFIAADKVTDAPGPHGFYSNFVPDPDAVRAGLDRFLALTRPRPAVPSWTARPTAGRSDADGRPD